MKKGRVLLFFLFGGWLLAASAQELGERLAPWTLLDQFDQAYSLNDDLRVLLVARDMAAAKLVEQALADKSRGYLERRSAVYVADISGMPGPIASLFAVPAMRDYSYRVLLDRQGRVAPRYPGAKGAVVWLDLREGRLQAQRTFVDAPALAQALEDAAR